MYNGIATILDKTCSLYNVPIKKAGTTAVAAPIRNRRKNFVPSLLSLTKRASLIRSPNSQTPAITNKNAITISMICCASLILLHQFTHVRQYHIRRTTQVFTRTVFLNRILRHVKWFAKLDCNRSEPIILPFDVNGNHRNPGSHRHEADPALNFHQATTILARPFGKDQKYMTRFQYSDRLLEGLAIAASAFDRKREQPGQHRPHRRVHKQFFFGQKMNVARRCRRNDWRIEHGQVIRRQDHAPVLGKVFSSFDFYKKSHSDQGAKNHFCQAV